MTTHSFRPRSHRFALVVAAVVALGAFTALAATFTVTSTNDSGAGSLRQAILEVNLSTNGLDTIAFAIPPFDGTVKTITPTNTLPSLANPVILDGFSQPTSSVAKVSLLEATAALQIQIDARFVETSHSVFELLGGNSAIRGLVINNLGNGANGVTIQGNGGSVVEGVFIGTDATGTSLLGAGNIGILIQNSISNIVRAAALSPPRVTTIAGQQSAITIDDGLANLVEGCFLGTDSSGSSALGNGMGVDIGSGSRGNRVVSNVCSGNGTGVRIEAGSGNNSVQGNFIGLDVAGTTVVSNVIAGVTLFGSNNFIGTGNLISGNKNNVLVFSPGNSIEGNFIGTLADGVSSAGSQGFGIFVNTTDTTIQGNTIAGNENGVVIVGNSSFNNAVKANSFFFNTGPGIDLGFDGVNTNDDCDADTGVNHKQNFPELLSATNTENGLVIQGNLNSTADNSFYVEFFASQECDDSGFGEGQTYLGATNVTIGADCSNQFTVTLPVFLPAGTIITSTATDPNNNTSEFSACQAVEGPEACQVICPNNITVTNVPYECFAVVDYQEPTVSPACGPVTCTPSSGSEFPVGTTEVDCTFADIPALTVCKFTVTVIDADFPVVDCGRYPLSGVDIIVAAAPGGNSAMVNFDSEAWDNCDEELSVNCNPPSGSSFPVGTTPVTCTATDSSGNTSTCNFNVIVEPPGTTLEDIAFKKLKALKKVTFKVGDTSVIGEFFVTIQNRSPHNEIIPDLPTLQNLVIVTGFSLGGCPSFQAMALPPKLPFPITLKPGKSLKVPFTHHFDCINDPLPSTKTARHYDYKVSVAVNHAALPDSLGDTNPSNDISAPIYIDVIQKE